MLAPKINGVEIGNKCYGYVRVSTQKQAKEGYSLEFQIEQITEYAKYNKYELLEMVEEQGKSGLEKKLEKRKELSYVLNVIKPGETLIVYTLSRLSRSIRDFLDITKRLETKGCALVLIKDKMETITAFGRFGANLMAILGQLESDMLMERVAEINSLKHVKGQFIGRIPYGWRLSNGPGSEAKEVVHEQFVIYYIRYLRGKLTPKGKPYTYQKIANKLNELYIQPPGKSTKWHDNAVKRILNRKSGTNLMKDNPAIIEKISSAQTVEDMGLPIQKIKFQIGLNFYC